MARNRASLALWHVDCAGTCGVGPGRRLCVVALLGRLLTPSPAAGGDADDEAAGAEALPSLSETRVGVREKLARRGVEIGLTVYGDPSVNLRGGIRQGGAVRVPLHAELDVHTDRLAGWSGGRIHFGVHALEGRNAGELLVGDVQGFDNADAPRLRQLSELWLQQELLGGRLRLKVGKSDANVDFAHVEAGSEFLNSSAGFSPTIGGFPSYPDPAMGFALLSEPVKGLSIGAGVYDGTSADGVHGRTGNRGVGTFFRAEGPHFAVGEAALSAKLKSRAARIAVGAWRHAGPFAGVDGNARTVAAGGYAILEHRLWEGTADGSRGIDLFAQLGASGSRVAEVVRHAALGLAAVGPLAGRDRDVMGLLVTSVAVAAPRAANGQRTEVAIELYYGLALRRGLSVKPDLQYIVNPGVTSARNALVATLRVTLTY